MKPFYIKPFFIATIFVFFCASSKAQTGLCPSNLNFEIGDFTGWECRYGAGTDILPLPNIGQQANRHTIITAGGAGLDPYGGFPELCPNGSNYSVRLGNNQIGNQAESISYIYTIPSNLTVFSMLFHYAVVLQNPNHTSSQQPRFRARITDMSTNQPINCVDFDFISGNSTGGFFPSPIDPNVLYKDWTPISINLNAYIGRTIKLEFVSNDCTLGGHFGYAYLDVNTNCNGVISGNFICPGDTSLTLTAPFGFQNYEWYADQTYGTILSTSQTLYLNPLPTVGTIYPVVVIPYTGFGCRDTMFATIDVGTPPNADAGPDQFSCQLQPVPIGAPPNPSYTYSWTPASQVSNPTISDPIALPSPAPTQYIVDVVDILNGCKASDTTWITPFASDTSLAITGKVDYCPDELSKAVLSVNSSLSAIQWYDASGPIPGATGPVYQPTATGSYWAAISDNGCPDSTRTVGILIYPFPAASFTPDADTGCVTRNSFLFTNSTSVADGSVLSYIWSFHDGSQQTITDATKVYTDTGRHTIKLLATSANGCKDSTTREVVVMPNGNPDFLWDSICTNRPMLFHNLSVENGSPLVNYIWDFGNSTGSNLKDPLPVSYGLPAGWKDVNLKLVALGCENDTQTVTRSVLVNRAASGIRYPDITVPLGSSRFIHVRDSIGKIYNWKPSAQLSSYWTQYTEFYATNDDIEYLIDITDQHTCVTTDTMKIFILKKPGYYLPTAFTPNGDGLNDVAKPYLVGMKGLKNFTIFDRWGNRVFYTTREGEGWDGRFKGESAANGVYVWVLVFLDADNKEVMERGTITIIR